MSSEAIDDRAPEGARAQGATEESTAELPVLVLAEPEPAHIPVPASPAPAVYGRARVAWQAVPLSHEATVPIAIPANLLGDEPVQRASLPVTVAVHGVFLLIAIVLVVVLMVVTAH